MINLLRNRRGNTVLILPLMILTLFYFYRTVQLRRANRELINSIDDIYDDIYKEFPGIGIRISPIFSPLTVKEVIPNTPAESDGIRPNDEILKLNGRQVANFIEFKEMIAEIPIGNNAILELNRGGKKMIIKTKVVLFRRQIISVPK